MNRSTKNLSYILLAVLLLFVAVQRFRAFATRRQTASSSYARLAHKSPSSQFQRQIGTRNNRLKEQSGKTLLWAKGDPQSADSEWFNVTDIPIDPLKFQYGIGKDTIPAIDEPVFVDANDPRLAEQDITNDSRVIGYAVGGDARAYPIRIMNRHELVNDNVAGKPVTVAW